jgi:hypothetical protein
MAALKSTNFGMLWFYCEHPTLTVAQGSVHGFRIPSHRCGQYRTHFNTRIALLRVPHGQVPADVFKISLTGFEDDVRRHVREIADDDFEDATSAQIQGVVTYASAYVRRCFEASNAAMPTFHPDDSLNNHFDDDGDEDSPCFWFDLEDVQAVGELLAGRAPEWMCKLMGPYEIAASVEEVGGDKKRVKKMYDSQALEAESELAESEEEEAQNEAS